MGEVKTSTLRRNGEMFEKFYNSSPPSQIRVDLSNIIEICSNQQKSQFWNPIWLAVENHQRKQIGLKQP